MSQPLFSTFPKFVDDELKSRRQKVNSSRPRKLQRPKSPWMRMVSGFDPADGERKVLMGGDLDLEESLKFGFDELYEPTADTGEKYRPAPSIDSITVDEKLESFECSVEWTVNSVDQLDRLFPFFMNLGTSLVVDWGWDDVPPNAILDPTDEASIREQYRTLNVEEAQPERVGGAAIQGSDRQRNAVQSANENFTPRTVSRFNHPKYDVLQAAEGRYSFVVGVISNFSFSPQGNSQYSCTTEITSLSKATSKLVSLGQENIRDLDETPEEKPKIKKDLKKFLDEDLRDYLKDRAEAPDKDVIRFDAGGEFNRREDLDTDFTYYLSWREIEGIVNRHASYSELGRPGSGEKRTTANGEIRTFEFDSAASIVGSFETGKVDKNRNDPLQLRSLDPLICIVDVSDVDSRFRTFSEVGPEAERHVTGSLDPKREGMLYNLYVEWQIVKDAFDKVDTIIDGMQYILDKCSGACFQIWNFEPIIDLGAIRFIDKNTTDNNVSSFLNEDQQGTEHVFRPNTNDSILRDFSFDTNMDDKIKGQIVGQKHTNLEGKKENAAINNRNDATGQYFRKQFNGRDVVTENNLKKEAELEDEVEQHDTVRTKSPSLNTVKEESVWAGWLGNPTDYEAQRKDATQTFIEFPGESTRKLVYKNYGAAGRAKAFARVMQADTAENSPINGNLVLNINAQFTLDGIGGLCAHQALRIENIPRVFRNNGIYMIESVSHSVSSDDWTTEVKTKYLVNNQLEQSSESDE